LTYRHILTDILAWEHFSHDTHFVVIFLPTLNLTNLLGV